MIEKKTYRIAALIPIGAEYSGRLLEGAIAYAREHDDVAILDRAYLRESGDPLEHMQLDFDAALVWLRKEENWVERLLDQGITVVNTSGDSPHPDIKKVAFKGSSLIAEVAEYVSTLRRPNVAIIGNELLTDSPALVWRAERFAAKCHEMGMQCEVVPLGKGTAFDDRTNYLSEAQAGRLSRWLSTIKAPTVAWCQDDHFARLVCDQAKIQGMEVPRQLAVIGLFDYRVCLTDHPTLSTLPFPGQDIAREAVRLIHTHLKDGTPIPDEVAIPSPAVIVRESTNMRAQNEVNYYLAHRIIQNRACEGLMVADLLDIAEVSQHTFSKKFLEIFGRTPGAEIRRVRLEHAKNLLLRTNHSIKEISTLCGFEEPGKFSQFFKRETGKKPTEFRERST